jgi:iron complex transport system ATP-binding protein
VSGAAGDVGGAALPLETRNLGFSYGRREVLRDISFTLGRGELLGLLGPNGSGKSTLFRCVLGLDRGYSGLVLMEGEDIRRKEPAAMARLAAYVPQIHQPSFNYSALDMVLMGAGGGQRPTARQKEAAEAALETLGIADLRDRDFRRLSGGEQQLVLIARALAQGAKILVMDEPTANLDYGNQIRLLIQIKDLSRRGYSVLLSTHNPDHAFSFADRVIALQNAEIAAAGPPAEVLTAEFIRSLYGVDVRPPVFRPVLRI